MTTRQVSPPLVVLTPLPSPTAGPASRAVERRVQAMLAERPEDHVHRCPAPCHRAYDHRQAACALPYMTAAVGCPGVHPTRRGRR